MSKGSISVDIEELKSRTTTAVMDVSGMDLRTPEQVYKTYQLEKFMELHQELYELTQIVKDVIRHDLEAGLQMGIQMMRNDQELAMILRRWGNR